MRSSSVSGRCYKTERQTRLPPMIGRVNSNISIQKNNAYSWVIPIRGGVTLCFEISHYNTQNPDAAVLTFNVKVG